MELHYKSVGNEIFRNAKRGVGATCKMFLANSNQSTSLFDGDSLSGKRIAIVGNAPMNQGYAEAIDSHDIVVRCNKGLFSPEINPRISGRKTDICFAGAISVLMNTRFKSVLSNNPEVILVAPFSDSDDEVILNRLVAHLFYKQRIQYLCNEYMEKIFQLVSQDIRPSTGFIASNIALQQSPGNVNLYGFSFSDFNRITNRRSYTTQHDFLDEKRYIMGLQNSGILLVHE